MKRNKYRVAKPEHRTWMFKCYDSKAEMEFAKLMHARLGVDIDFIREQPKIDGLGVPENVYRPDFWILYSDGASEYVDVKGQETAKFKKDKKLWARYGPGVLKVVKKRNTKFEVTDVIESDQSREPAPDAG